MDVGYFGCIFRFSKKRNSVLSKVEILDFEDIFFRLKISSTTGVRSEFLKIWV